eukprot:TRINITY_DN6683_c0_g1_i1.p1 TRINITY_DN6683_c0_g1~~TRINITY_DN6683_c0_g1_i1.p1  ORF type:complete len:210 (-),score=30.02 TRINITY_DN6683_c0_g1_i1:517-1146(-)
MQDQLNLAQTVAKAKELHISVKGQLDLLLTNPQAETWATVIEDFSQIALKYHRLYDMIGGALKHNIVRPKLATQDNAPVLPFMMATKMLPEQEQEQNTIMTDYQESVEGRPLKLQIAELLDQVERFNSILSELLTQTPLGQPGVLNKQGDGQKKIQSNSRLVGQSIRELRKQMDGSSNKWSSSTKSQSKTKSDLLVAAVLGGHFAEPEK